jgi:uncharacterized RDD family membrane protein YckC
MNPEANPYSPPLEAIADHPCSGASILASRGARLSNWLTDGIFIHAFTGLFCAFIAPRIGILAHLGDSRIGGPEIITWMIISISYRTLFEGLTGYTIGKICSCTKVADAKGNNPSLAKAFVRSLCRYIPLDPLSLFGKTPIAWHDSISGTRVIKLV